MTRARFICPECNEAAHVSILPQKGSLLRVPADRLSWAHKDNSPLCPVMGTDLDGNSSYVPALPVANPKVRRFYE